MRRTRRDRDDIREVLLEAALVEFGAHGFDGASTRAIAARAEAHQPQINYHFASKEDLWRASVAYLFEQLDAALVRLGPSDDPVERFAEMLTRLVRFAAARPQLHQIIVQEATAPSERLDWMVTTYVAPRHAGLVVLWREVRAAGAAAPVGDDHIHHMVMGAVSLVYVNATEARLLHGRDPVDPARIEAHADAVVALFLPGRVGRVG